MIFSGPWIFMINAMKFFKGITINTRIRLFRKRLLALLRVIAIGNKPR
jgi:hypothetical protein